MLVHLKEILEIAENKAIAIGSFNTPTLEMIRGTILAAQELQVPVILSHAQVHEDFIPLDEIGPILKIYAEKVEIPVAIHLDHATDIDYIQKAIAKGFTSVMYDGSSLSFEENMENTRKVVELAAQYGVSVEGELGTIGSSNTEHAETQANSSYTDPCRAKEFVEYTGIDALAASFGTIHGVYRQAPKLDFQRIQELKEICKVPIVMHGGSGLSKKDFKTCIHSGVRKINYFTAMAISSGEAVRKSVQKEESTFYPLLTQVALETIKKEVGKAMEIFSK